MKPESAPLFIVVDGGDGSGKDTQSRFIASYYLKRGYKVRIRSHPSIDNFFGQHSRRALEEGGKKGHLKAAIFYTADVIRSLVKYYRHSKGEIIIFCRYLLGVCYLPSVLVPFGYNFFERLLPKSNYFFYLKVTPEVARQRITKRGAMGEMFETLPRLKKMSKKMNLITQQKKWHLINGDKTPIEVWEEIRNILDVLESDL